MFISKAYAQEVAADVTSAITDAPTPANAFAWNMGLIALLVVMFYVLLIRPQQKRFQQHKEMLDGLKKGDKIVTAGGLVGKVDKIKEGEDEVVIDLGKDMKVIALRSTIQTTVDRTQAQATKKTDAKDKK